MARAWGGSTSLGTVLAPLVAGGLAGAYVFFHFENPAFRGLFIPGRRYDHFANAAAFWPLVLSTLAVICALTLAAIVVGRIRGAGEPAKGVLRASAWLLLLPLHEAAFYAASLYRAGPMSSLYVIVDLTPAFVCAAAAGWLSGLWNIMAPNGERVSKTPLLLLSMAAIFYALVFSALPILQSRALHSPHGDTGMFEEHLWNVLNGKGFRSQLDDGRLFLGEHFEVIHLLLLPAYAFLPSLDLLHVCSAALVAGGAFFVYGIGKALKLDGRSSARLGMAYLAYFPLQALNLEESWKTFRPETFGIPIVLCALWGLETGRQRVLIASLLLSALCKEEYLLLAAAIGLYLAWFPLQPSGRRLLGGVILLLSIGFLALTLSVLIPLFREGAPPHYSVYFSGLGDTPAEILRTLVNHPLAALAQIMTRSKMMFLLLLFLPLALTPIASPARLLVGAPIFGYLLLGEREGFDRPWFHFHGPLVPILFWSTVGGVANLRRWISARALSRYIVSICLVTGLFWGRSPLSLRFYDPLAGSPRVESPWGSLFKPEGAYWRDLYLPDERARAFDAAIGALDPSERIATTDYVRNRFTHFAAAHDYPTLRRHVGIDDIDAIVIDKREGWWGRGEGNPDQELLECMKTPARGPGTRISIRGRPFVILHHDPYFLVARKIAE